MKKGLFALLALGVWVQEALAIPGVGLSFQETNVVLRWPSTPGDVFAIYYRPTLSAETPWTMIETNWPAATNLSETTFVHSNAAPPGMSVGMSSLMRTATAASATRTVSDRQSLQQRLAQVAQNRPPMPPDPMTLTNRVQRRALSQGASRVPVLLEQQEVTNTVPPAVCGFYRSSVTPRTRTATACPTSMS